MEVPSSWTASSVPKQKVRFTGPLPMVRLVQGFSQGGTPHRLYDVPSGRQGGVPPVGVPLVAKEPITKASAT